jgi:hypothetical protein
MNGTFSIGKLKTLGHGWGFFEAKLREPQPWFDDEDPEEYLFQARNGLENWTSTLSELEARRT